MMSNSTRRLHGMIAVGMIIAAAPAAAAPVFERTTTQPITLSATPADAISLLTATVPIGTWTVLAKAALVNYGPADIVRCIIFANGTRDSAATSVGAAGNVPFVADIALSTVVSVAAGRQTVILGCFHDAQLSGIYVDAGATLTVAKVGPPTP